MSPAARRVGAETSKTRDTILDCVEKLMVREGYPSVTYRVLAAEAGVTPSLVQYYFPTLDSIFIAALGRRTVENVQRLRETLAARPGEALHVMWEFSLREASGALVTEFMALGNHRKSIGVEIAKVTGEIRQVQVDALLDMNTENNVVRQTLSPEALVAMISGFPKMLNLERGIGITTAHDELVAALEAYVDALEPASPPAPRRKSGDRRARG